MKSVFPGKNANREASEFFGVLQEVVDSLFVEADTPKFTVSRLSVVLACESADIPDDLLEIVNLLPPGDYTRQMLCDQLNSSISGHAWGQVYGTVQ